MKSYPRVIIIRVSHLFYLVFAGEEIVKMDTVLPVEIVEVVDLLTILRLSQVVSLT